MPLPLLIPAAGSAAMKGLNALMIYMVAKEMGMFDKYTEEGSRMMSGMETMRPSMNAPFGASAEMRGMEAGVDTMERAGDWAKEIGKVRQHYQSIDKQNLDNLLTGKQALLTRASSLRPSMQQSMAALVSSGAM